MPSGKRCGRRDYKRSLVLPFGLAANPDERRTPRAPFVSQDLGISPAFPLELTEHSPAQVQPFAHQRLPSRGGFQSSCFSVLFGLPFQAGILKFSPRCSTAQHMRAFLAAMATTARQ